jgi:hypothetical protein
MKRWMVGCALATVMSTGAMALKIGGGGDPRKIDLAQTYDFSADPATAAITYIVSTGKIKFENIKKVAVSSCTVGLVYAKGAEGKSSGSTMSFNASATSAFPGGVPTERVREAVDNFCDQIESDLKAAGYEVVPYDEIAAKPAYQKYAQKFSGDPELLKEDIDLGNQKGAKAKNLVLVVSGKNRPYPKDVRFPNPSTTMARVKLVYDKDMEGITLLSVNTTLDFAKVDAKGGFWHGAKADMEYGEFIPPGEPLSAAYFFSKDGSINFWQKQAMVAAKNPFVEGDGKVTRDGSYDDLSGVSTMTTSKETTINADHALWSENANSLLKALSAMFVQSLKNADKK